MIKKIIKQNCWAINDDLFDFISSKIKYKTNNKIFHNLLIILLCASGLIKFYLKIIFQANKKLNLNNSNYYILMSLNNGYIKYKKIPKNRQLTDDYNNYLFGFRSYKIDDFLTAISIIKSLYNLGRLIDVKHFISIALYALPNYLTCILYAKRIAIINPKAKFISYSSTLWLYAVSNFDFHITYVQHGIMKIRPIILWPRIDIIFTLSLSYQLAFQRLNFLSKIKVRKYRLIKNYNNKIIFLVNNFSEDLKILQKLNLHPIFKEYKIILRTHPLADKKSLDEIDAYGFMIDRNTNSFNRVIIDNLPKFVFSSDSAILTYIASMGILPVATSSRLLQNIDVNFKRQLLFYPADLEDLCEASLDSEKYKLQLSKLQNEAVLSTYSVN